MTTAIIVSAIWAFFLWMQHKEAVELRQKLLWEYKSYARLKRYSLWLEADIGSERVKWLNSVAVEEWETAHRGPTGDGVADMTTPAIPHLDSIHTAYKAAQSRRN